MYYLVYDPDEACQDFCLLYAESPDAHTSLICDWSDDPHDFHFWDIGEDPIKYTLADYLDNSDGDTPDFIVLATFDTCPTLPDIVSFLTTNHPDLLI